MINERQIEIIELCKLEEYIDVKELVRKLKVSEATIRRDLSYLESEGLVIRVRGGVILPRKEGYPKKNKKTENGINCICKYAASLIKPKQMVYMDSGSTIYNLTKYTLPKDISVVTNGILLAQALYDKGINTFILQGFMHNDKYSVYSMDSINSINNFKFDLSFIGVSGIHEEKGFSSSGEVGASIKRAVIKNSKKTYVLADSTKFDIVGFCNFAEINELEIITDNKIDFNYQACKVTFTER